MAPKKTPISSSLKEFAYSSVTRDIGKLEKKMDKLKNSILNHTNELTQKEELLLKYNKEIEELKVIQYNCQSII
jgi:hypothetical protein